MISVAYLRQMARYNRWQNESLYAVAGGLPDEERRRERGAFFGSIHGTLNHLLWADGMWLNRFAGTPKPAVAGITDSVRLHESWDELTRARASCDAAIMDWADGLDPAWLEGDLTWYSGSAKRDVTRPKGLLATHLFNHATHHRGQVHCMLTQAGAKGYVSDLAFMPD